MEPKQFVEVSLKTSPLYFFLVCSTAISALATDMIIPALGVIQDNFAISYLLSQSIISVFLLFFAIGQLFVGFLSDRYGKVSVLKSGLIIYILGSFLCYVSLTYQMLVLGRMIQAVGASAGLILARALAKEYYTPERLKAVISDISVASAAVSLISPFFSAVVIEHYHWRMIFLCMILFSGATFVLSLLTKFNQNDQCKNQKITFDFLNKDFFQGTIVVAGTFSMLFCFVSLSPSIFMKGNVTPVFFSLIYAGGVTCFMIGNQLSKIHRLSNKKLALLIIFISGLLFLIDIQNKNTLFYCLIFSSAVFNMAAGILYPLGHALALNVKKNSVGVAASVTGFIQTVVASIVSYGASLFVNPSENNAVILGFIITCIALLQCILLFQTKQTLIKETIYE